MTSKGVGRSVELGLRVIGCWPDCRFTLLYRVFWTTSILAIQVYQYRYLVARCTPDDLSELMDVLGVALAYSLLLVKMLVFWANHRVVCHMVAEMGRDWREHAADPDGGAMEANSSFSDRCSRYIVALYAMASILYGVGTMAKQAKPTNDSTPRELIIKMELPFDSSVSPLYELVVVGQIVHHATGSAVAGMIPGLLITLTLHAGGQIDTMCERLASVSTVDDGDDRFAGEVKRFVVKHHRIIAFTDDIERAFTYIALPQFLSCTFIMCSLGYQIIMSIGTEDQVNTIVKALWFYSVISLEAFIFCYAGEYLGMKSKSIGNAAYDSRWYNAKPNESRCVLIVVARSQKQMTLTVGKFMDLTLERFTTMMKASASYISVLHAMS